MSSVSSAVTYTSVYTDSELGRVFWGADKELSDGGRVFWGADKELSDEGSSRVIVYGYDRLLMQLVAPPSPDYIQPMYPEYIPLEDEHVLLAEEQPLPPVDSPTAKSPGYDEEEDEHLAPADFAVVIPTVELVSSPEGTEPVIPPPSTNTTTIGARITVRLQAAIC
nr:hypothetical protein [Tanacetum cinerariifolium]